MTELYIYANEKSISKFGIFATKFGVLAFKFDSKKGQDMLCEKLKELRKRSGLTNQQIAIKADLSESTVNRMFMEGESMPLASNLYRAVKVMGGSLDDILSDTCAFVAPPSIVDVKETADVVEAELQLVRSANKTLEAKVAALEMENELLKKELLHKEELLAVHNYYIKRGLSEQ